MARWTASTEEPESVTRPSASRGHDHGAAVDSRPLPSGHEHDEGHRVGTRHVPPPPGPGQAEQQPVGEEEEDDNEEEEMLGTAAYYRKRSSLNIMSASHPRPSAARSRTTGDGDSIAEEWGEPSSSEHSMEMGEFHSDEELIDDEETGLTEAERKKRRRRKRRHMRLDERIAGGRGLGGDGAEHDDDDDEASRREQRRVEKQLVNAALVKDALINAVLIGLWYGFSISISVYNKWMFSADNLDFHFPLFSTSMHMLVQFTLASLVLLAFPRFRPVSPAPSSVPEGRGDYAQLASDGSTTSAPKDNPPKPLMTQWFYLTRIGPCGTATALDIGLGNFSLRFISLTFYTMCKSSVLAFVLTFAFLFRLERPTWKLCAVIGVMTAGVIMMVAGETAFNPLGFVLVMAAAFCSGFRWSLTQILLLRNPATSNPFSSIFFLTPVMFLALFCLALPIEGPASILSGVRILTASKGLVVGYLILLFPGVLAFMMVSAEFALLLRTSVVTLSVCGIFKEVLTISAASMVFGDELSPINISGLLVTIASIAGYNVIKYNKMKSEAKKEVHQRLEAEEARASLQRERESMQSQRSHDGRPGLVRDSLSSAGERPAVSNGPAKRPENLE